MFIVNERGNICEEVKTITMEVRENELITEKINKKAEALEYGYAFLPYSVRLSTVECKLKEYIKDYENELEITVICINGKEFGIYNKEEAAVVFQNIIIDALQRNEILFDLRNHKSLKE